MDYSKTLNLPQTDFPMKGNLPVREPQILKFWEDHKIAQLVTQKTKGKPKRILHDGPPYSNGRIHLGQAFNKILKDFVTKFWTLTGYDSPYVPGWDTHGLPNELEAIKSFKLDRKKIEPSELRKKCRESALHYVDIQREQFKRLGIRGVWDSPYLTLDPTYESKIVEAFGTMSNDGYIYRGKKSVYWCPTCETSLAEAEIEYKDKQSHSIYVKFPLQNGQLSKKFREKVPDKPIYVLIWTTTPWTLPGNVAVALHPDEVYALAKASNGEFYFLAEKLIPNVAKAAGIELEALERIRGIDAAQNSSARHPFLDRDSKLIHQTYVTMEDGTGIVHTAPGHGQEDFQAAELFDLPILVPVNGSGILTNEAGPFAGLHVLKDANQKIIDYLREHGSLLASGTIQHSYPHCWRCHNPIIFRATEQWFVKIDHRDLRAKSLASLKTIKWFPNWGEERMGNMIRERPDWCISRQRTWGVPIPVFYCEACGKPISSAQSIETVRSLFQKEGADSWYTKPASKILPKGFTCPHCKSAGGFKKEMDIFDVWFESGVSHLAVLQTRPELQWPCELYLEGPDQYRGWFQVSLLSAMAVKEKPPYHGVLTHGWTLDLEGRAMHKSLGNAIDPMDILKDYGADILRLFFASVDFKGDVRIGDKSLKDVSEAYRKIRNTARFLLGNLYDFDPAKHNVAYPELCEIDRWALLRLYDLVNRVRDDYENYDFHLVYVHVLNFCVNDLSAIYLDVLKDRLYTFPAGSRERRSAQTVLHAILMSLIRVLSPILSFTTEDLWQSVPHTFKDGPSVELSDWPKVPEMHNVDDAFKARWEKLLAFREKVYAKIEEARQAKLLRQPLEAAVSATLSPDQFKEFSRETHLLGELLIVSKLELKEGTAGPEITVTRAPGEKCARCWHYSETISAGEYPGLCERCLPVVENGDGSNLSKEQ